MAQPNLLQDQAQNAMNQLQQRFVNTGAGYLDDLKSTVFENNLLSSEQVQIAQEKVNSVIEFGAMAKPLATSAWQRLSKPFVKGGKPDEVPEDIPEVPIE